jgi:predicted nucleic acid-binding protein
MTRYLLDTDAIIDFSKGSEPATARILSWIDAGDTLAICAISLAEFCAGLTPEEVSHWRLFLTSLTYLDVTREATIRAGQYRYHFARVGKSLSLTDALMAAVAHGKDAILVTGNVKDYPMDDVSLFSIR